MYFRASDPTTEGAAAVEAWENPDVTLFLLATVGITARVDRGLGDENLPEGLHVVVGAHGFSRTR